jgi:hypothetical protein
MGSPASSNMVSINLVGSWPLAIIAADQMTRVSEGQRFGIGKSSSRVGR